MRRSVLLSLTLALGLSIALAGVAFADVPHFALTGSATSAKPHQATVTGTANIAIVFDLGGPCTKDSITGTCLVTVYPVLDDLVSSLTLGDTVIQITHGRGTLAIINDQMVMTLSLQTARRGEIRLVITLDFGSGLVAASGTAKIDRVTYRLTFPGQSF
jgi:hypothetical protein